MAGLSIKNLTRRPVAPRATFVAIAKTVLPLWDISLVFVGPAKALDLNKKLRGKTYTPNVLSYVAGKKSGEIIICLSAAEKQVPSFNLSLASYTLLLFIHGLLHLKGRAHGATMERCERKLLARYGTTYSDRHRHRHVPSKDGRRRGVLR